MPRPPGSKFPPVIFSRPAYEWINRVNQEHKKLTEMALTPEQQTRLRLRLETEFVRSALRLEGVDPSPELTGKLRESLRLVESLAENQGRDAALTPQLLLRLHDPTGNAELRKSAGDTNRLNKPVAAQHLPVSIESACLWFAAESFTELNPVEQAAIAYLRLLDLQPFEDGNERTALLAASLFTVRSGLPPVILRPEQDAAYRAALEEGIRMDTRPMVELMAEAVELTLRGMVEIARKGLG